MTESALAHPDVKSFFTKGPPQMIVTDVDGTLLDPDHKLSDRALDVLSLVTGKLRIPVLFATGKTFHSTLDVRKKLNMLDDSRCFGININGLVIHDHLGNIIESNQLDKVNSLIVLKEAWRRGLPVVVYSEMRILAREVNKLTRLLHDYHEPDCEINSELEEFIESGTEVVNKVVLLVPYDEEAAIRAEFGKVIDASKVSCTSTVKGMLEFGPPALHKATALATVCDMLKVDINRVIAFGDGENDAEMLQLAGLGCAMKNGGAVAIKAANVTIGSNAEAGQAEFLAAVLGLQAE